MECNMGGAAGRWIRLACLLNQHAELRDALHTYQSEAVIQICVLTVRLLCQVIAARHLHQESCHSRLGEDLNRPMQAILAVVQVHGMLYCCRLHFAHRAPHSQELPQALRKEDSVDVKLDSPVVVLVCAQSVHLLPDYKQRWSVERCPPSATQGYLQAGFDEGHVDRHRLPSTKLRRGVCEYSEAVTSKHPNTLCSLLREQRHLPTKWQREREAVEGDGLSMCLFSSPLFNVMPLPKLFAILRTLPSGSAWFEACPPLLREELICAGKVSETQTATVCRTPFPHCLHRPVAYLVKCHALPLNVWKRISNDPSRLPSIILLRDIRLNLTPDDPCKGLLQQ
mmetsp:Transcript_63629/g.186132  ORF Transcript_63629/g.186132 Transcript_63629/m.186132 type:complete len:339 (-) Transcript_63629:565-1581(-)